MQYENKLQNGNLLRVKVLVPGLTQDHFSVTAEEISSDRRRREPLVACGRMHAEVLERFPILADVVALHLCDKDGAPMYAVANGHYWLAGAAGGLGERFHGGNGNTPEWRLVGRTVEIYCRDVLASHLRVSPECADEILAQVSQAFTSGGSTSAKEVFSAIVDGERARWRQEAQAAIAKYA